MIHQVLKIIAKIDTITVNKNESVIIDPSNISQPLKTSQLEIDEWIIQNLLKDDGFMTDVHSDLLARLGPYIPELKEKFGISDEELSDLLEGYIQGYYDIPPETPDWVRDIIELS